MKSNKINLYLFVFCALSAVFVSSVGTPVHASPLQVTATRDIRTPPPTPTAGGSGYQINTAVPTAYGCPAGLPVGYGTVTPDALWLLTCGSCIPTNTPWPTLFPTSLPTLSVPVCTTPDGGGAEVCTTATPLTTVTPTVTVTSTPSTSTISCYGSDVSFLCNQIDDYTIEYYGSGFSSGPLAEINAGYSLDFAAEVTAVFDLVGDGVNFAHVHDPSPVAVAVYDFSWTDSSYFNIPLPFNHSSCGSTCGNEVSTGNHTYTFFANPGLHMIAFNPDANNNEIQNLYFNFGSTVRLSTLPLDLTPTPTPTGTLFASGYCDAIGGDFNLEEQELLFWGPPGEPVCTVIPSLDTSNLLDLLNVFSLVLPAGVTYMLTVAVAFFSVTTPAATVCIQAYEILEVNFFGVTISLAVFASIFLVGYIINHFTNR